MAVFRIRKEKNYTSMANYHFKDKTLSWKAKGILSNMLSLPDSWDYSLAGLATLSSDGMSATRSAIKELEEHGYLIRRPIREGGRICDWEYLIFENPQTAKQIVDKQDVENQQIENHTQLNTNRLKTNQSNIKESNTDKYISIIARLNEKANTNYRPNSKATQGHIKARLAEGFTVEDFFKVIDKKCDEWKGGEMEKYLRPETLFGSKFENYLNAPAVRRGANGIAIDQNAPDDLAGIL